MDIIGILLKKVGEREGVSSRNGNAWKMAEFLVEIPEHNAQRKKYSVFQVSDGQNDRIKRFEQLIGKWVKVSFDMDAHEYQGRWFNDITAWGIMEYVAGKNLPETHEAATGEAKADPQPAQAGDQNQGEQSNEEENDGLPF